LNTDRQAVFLIKPLGEDFFYNWEGLKKQAIFSSWPPRGRKMDPLFIFNKRQKQIEPLGN